MLQFWFPKEEFYTYLQPMIGYSDFCRKAIIKEIQIVFSDQYADEQIGYHQNQIKEWKDKKKASREDTGQVKEILEVGYREFKERQEKGAVDSHGFNLYLRSNILPKLKKAHCNRFDEKQIVEMYLKGEIHA